MDGLWGGGRAAAKFGCDLDHPLLSGASILRWGEAWEVGLCLAAESVFREMRGALPDEHIPAKV